MSIDARPTVAAPDDDPYVWLEDIEGVRALAWVEAQNAATLAKFGTAGFAKDRDTLAAILDRPDNIPFVIRRGPHLYNFWKDAKNPRGLWRRTTLDSFRSDQPSWEVILDVDALAAEEKEDWVWHGASTLPGTHDRAILSLSRGGGDAAVLREFDIPAKAFVSGGFYLPEAKGGTDWLDRDTLLLSSAYGKGMATKSGYSRTVRLWRRGSDGEQAPVLIETTPESMGLWASVDRTQDAETVWFVDKPGFFDAIFWMGDRSGPKMKLDLPTDVTIEAHRGWMVVEAAHRMDDRRQDLRARHFARHLAAGISGRRARFHSSVRAGRAAGAAGLLLERRAADRFDPRRVGARVRGADAVGARLGAVETDGFAGDWRGQCRTPRHGGVRGQRRSARQRAGSHYASDDDADRARQASRRAQAGAAHIHGRWAGGHPPRSGVHRRRAHSVRAGWPARAKPATRPCT